MKSCSTVDLPWHSKAYCDHDEGIMVIADGYDILRCVITPDNCLLIGDDKQAVIYYLSKGTLANVKQCKLALFEISSTLKKKFDLDEMPHFNPRCGTVKTISISEIFPCSERSIVRHGFFQKAQSENEAEEISAIVMNSSLYFAELIGRTYGKNQ